MSYTIDRTIQDASFDEVDARARQALADSGFGIITEIDVTATMKKKLEVDMPAYRILGACNPKLAYHAIQTEPRIGSMLPCNVVLRAVDDGIEINAIDPLASMQAIDNAELKAFAGQVKDMLEKVVPHIRRPLPASCQPATPTIATQASNTCQVGSVRPVRISSNTEIRGAAYDSTPSKGRLPCLTP
ncbi:MAG: DUF302 domain-containing protein [Thiolinea sp.]